MRYPVKLEGFEGQTIEIQPGGFLSGPKLLVNRQSEQKGKKSAQADSAAK